MTAIKRVKKPSAAYLRTIKKYLAYDPQTGHVRCITPFGRHTVGTRCGRKIYQADGVTPKALQFEFLGRIVKNHHVAWYLSHNWWPSWLVDHRNGNPFDNRLDNIRHANYAENAANRRVSCLNKLGVRGVTKIKRKKGPGYTARCNGKHLGTCDTLAEATELYNNAALETYGEYARVNF